MSSCAKCGGSLANPFDFSNIQSTTCQCNTGGLVLEGDTLPNQNCCVVSVNEKTGKVVITIDDIDLLDKVFFTNALAVAAFTPTAPIGLDGSGNLTHDDSIVTPGTYGSDTEIPVFTVDAKGHVTGVTNIAMATPAIGDDLTAIEALTGVGLLIRTAANTWALRAIQGSSRVRVTDGDGVAGPPTVDLEDSGVISGTYGGNTSWPILTIDQFGRITSATTGTIPAVVIPAHTHALEDLSNVSSTSPSTGDALVWDGSEWVPSSSAINLSTSAVVCESFLLQATSSNDIDTVISGLPINNIYRLADTANRYEVSINAIFYVTEASLTGFPGTDISDLFIGTVPSGYEPMHPTYVSGPLDFNPVTAGLRNEADTVAFAGTQFLYALTFLIDTDGKIYLSVRGNSDYSCPTLTAVNNVILPLNCTYLTKRIVP